MLAALSLLHPARDAASGGARLACWLPLSLHRFFCELVARCCDFGWGVANYSWPVTLLWYLLCAPIAEIFFYLHCKRYLRVKSAAAHATFVSEDDSVEAERARTPRVRTQCVTAGGHPRALAS